MLNANLFGSNFVVDPDPDPGSEKVHYGSRMNFDTDLDPGKNERIQY